MKQVKQMSTGFIIALGFALIILFGAFILFLPITHNEGVNVTFINALFTATSSVCVTGLVPIDIADNFNFWGQLIVAILIQLGGLGFASIGVGFILFARKTVNFRERLILKDALNVDSVKGIVKLVQAVLLISLTFEGIGTVLNFVVFSKEYSPLKALWISIFHAVSAFNNCGYDILGGFKNLSDYKGNVLLNLTTCGLIIFGGLGFVVIKEILSKRSFKKLSLHSKIVVSMTLTLLAIGTILIKLTQSDISWLGAFFTSTVSRTAGFSTFSLASFTSTGLLIVIILMFMGASPGSTGGGIKTTTTFTLFKSAYALTTNKQCCAFKRKIPSVAISKAYVLLMLTISLISLSTLFVTFFDPELEFIDVLFEITSAFGTVGLSTGITPELSTISKFVVVLTMYIGRVGPLTIASLFAIRNISNVSYSEESIAIG